MSQFSGGQFGDSFPNNGGQFSRFQGPPRGRGNRGPRRPYGGFNGNTRFSGPRGGNPGSGYTNTGRGISNSYDDSDSYTGPMCVNPDYYTDEQAQEETGLGMESNFGQQPTDVSMSGDNTEGQFGNNGEGQFGNDVSNENIDNYYEQYEAGSNPADQSNIEKGSSFDSYTTSSYYPENSPEDFKKTATGVDQNQGNLQEETAEKNEEEEEEEEEESSDDDDTDFCKYCKIKFSSIKGYLAHLRGLQHTSLVMEAKSLKGDKQFQKETVAPEVLEVYIPKPKDPVESVASERDLVAEANWMELGEDVIDYIRDKQNLKDRDLHPDSIGKKQFDDNFSCPLCDIKCTGAASFKTHIDGKQHKNNLALAEQGAQVKKKKQAQTLIQNVDNKERPPKFDALRDKTQDALLGLEYITEFQKPDYKAAARYVCNMCESKCDGSTVIPHIIGMKHRLNYFKIHKPIMYDHLTKYTSKKKKSEMNANCEEFALEIEQEEGRKDVKVKLELEAENEEELEETMLRTSQALKEKMDELKNKATDTDVSAAKKPKLGPPEEEQYPPPPPWAMGRGRGHPPPPPGYGRGWGRDYWDPYMDDPYYGRPRPPGPPPPGLRHDMHADYRRRFDPYTHDPYFERRLHDERRYLDDLMLERHRLNDPLQEKRRLDDIAQRKTLLESLENRRVDSILERKRRLQEEDVDYQRLRRLDALKGRERPPEKPAPEKIVIDYQSTSSRPSMEELIARRRNNAELVSKMEERPRERDELLADRLMTEKKGSDADMIAKQAEVVAQFEKEANKNPNVNVTQLMDNLTSSMISTEEDASVALQLSSALTQALLKYRLHNAPKELSGVADLLQSQLEPTPEAPSIPGLGGDSSSRSVPSFLKASSKQATPQSQQAMPHSLVSPLYGYTEQTDTDSSHNASSMGYTAQASRAPAVTHATSSAYSAMYGVSSASYTMPSASNTAASQPSVSQSTMSRSNPYNTPAVSASKPYDGYSQMGGASASKAYDGYSQVGGTSASKPYDSYSHAGGMSASLYSQINSAPTFSGMVTTAPSTVQSTPALSSASLPTDFNPTNADQPQKQLLESIRKQTELIMKKISSTASTTPKRREKQNGGNVQSQMRHTPQSPSNRK